MGRSIGSKSLNEAEQRLTIEAAGRGSLQVRTGFCTACGKRSRNEDYFGFFAPTGPQLTVKGIVAAVADGIGGAAGGRVAAEVTVRGFIEGYYGVAETLSVERAAGCVLSALNRWIVEQGRQDPNLQNMATTFSALIPRGRQAHIIHVGDTRVYRLRKQRLQCLTADHTLKHPDMNHVVYRAVGIEEGLRIDYGVHSLEFQDRYLLCSDGVHGALNDRRIQSLLVDIIEPQEAAQQLVNAAIVAGGNDNATAMVVDIVALPAADHHALETALAALPIRDLPKTGDIIDSFRLDEMVADGRYSRIFRGEDLIEGRAVAIKFPHPRVKDDDAYRRAFAAEAWVTARVRSPWVAEVLEVAPGRQSWLYSVMPFYAGLTLEQRLLRGPPILLKEGVDIGVKLAKAVYALNRLQIIHRDIKPDNVILLSDGGLKLMDLGVARLPKINLTDTEETPGTPSYMAPEQFHGERGDEQSDVYALGVTLYRMFTGGYYPYGEIEPFSSPRFKRYTPLTHYRHDLPAWLDVAIGNAVAVEEQRRLNDAMEVAFELEHGFAHGNDQPITRKSPLYERNPLLVWQLLCLVLLMLLIAVKAYYSLSC